MATMIHSPVPSRLSAPAGLTTTAGPAKSPNPAIQQPGQGIDPLANEQTFLKLLVAQMRNQNPLNPTDSVQFVTQLAQFTQLEQTMAMRQDMDGIKADLDKAAAPPTSAP